MSSHGPGMVSWPEQPCMFWSPWACSLCPSDVSSRTRLQSIVPSSGSVTEMVYRIVCAVVEDAAVRREADAHGGRGVARDDVDRGAARLAGRVGHA